MVPSSVTTRTRGVLLRAGLGILGLSALLVVVTVVLVLRAPGANGFLNAITMTGGTIPRSCRTVSTLRLAGVCRRVRNVGMRSA